MPGNLSPALSPNVCQLAMCNAHNTTFVCNRIAITISILQSPNEKKKEVRMNKPKKNELAAQLLSDLIMCIEVKCDEMHKIKKTNIQ
jgi:hypothetical protein